MSAEYDMGMLHCLRIITENLEFWGILKEDEKDTIRNIIRQAMKRAEGRVKE